MATLAAVTEISFAFMAGMVWLLESIGFTFTIPATTLLSWARSIAVILHPLAAICFFVIEWQESIRNRQNLRLQKSLELSLLGLLFAPFMIGLVSILVLSITNLDKAEFES